MDERLRIPLSELWEDIRLPGLPVWDSNPKDTYEYHLAYNGRELAQVGNVGVVTHNLETCCLALTRPGASDILARRVAMAAGLNPTNTVHFHQLMGSHRIFTVFALAPGHSQYGQASWHGSGSARRIPTLADLDPTDDTRLDWGNLGSPRVVDLVALGLVAKRLAAQDLDGGT